MTTQSDYVATLFADAFNESAALIVAAPGRVNLMGDHTDYNQGFVLPAAIDFYTYIAASKRADNKVCILAQDCNQQTAEIDLDDFKYDSRNMWVNYVSGTLKLLRKSFPEIAGANIVVSGNVPQGSGLSSSASFEIALLKVYSELYGLELEGARAAAMGQKAENDFVGCNCGIMDQMVSALGKVKHAMFLDCRSLEIEHAPLPDDLSIFIVNSNVSRGLVDSEYNLRRQQCEQAAAFFGETSLRDVAWESLLDAQGNLDPVLFRRAKHVISENQRTLAAKIALQNNDIKSLNRLMTESHQSLQKDFEVSVKEMDGLVAIINQALGDQGGVRMTGGGFGGCVVALTPKHLLSDLSDFVQRHYSKKFGLEPSIYLCKASQGAFTL